MKKIILAATTFFCVTTLMAQKENIDRLCGCFEVSFKYAETFSPNKDYKYHDREVITGVTELALPIETSKSKIVIQHLLVMKGGEVVKHWREEWNYEPKEQWIYKGDKVWEKIKLNASEVKGKWQQTVWEVTDAPRYQGAASWTVVDGKTIWENTTDAPLPRREYTQRSDYNILKRTNRLVLLPNGYNHIQDNEKIIRRNGNDTLITEEKGYNTYTKIADTSCTAGREYWEAHKDYWKAVQNTWEAILSQHSRIELLDKVDNKGLIGVLFTQADEWKDKKLSKENLPTLVKSTIEKYIK